MDEAAWVRCNDLVRIFDFIFAERKASERQLRLFARAMVLQSGMTGPRDHRKQYPSLGKPLSLEEPLSLEDFLSQFLSLSPLEILERELIRSARNGRWNRELRFQEQDFPLIVHLFRHIIGNPFRPYIGPFQWPSSVTALATAMYDGEPCGFALHDALLEAGYPELAEHFRQETWHPQGCWVLDAILGKENASEID